MIKTHSDDPNVAAAAEHATNIISEVLSQLPKAESFDYGGQILTLGEYDVCTTCTTAIAEAQQADRALREKADSIDDLVVKEHVLLAAQLFEHEAYAATVRAEFHNGQKTEPILNEILGYLYNRNVRDEYTHNHDHESVL
jgi:hypothetical protein